MKQGSIAFNMERMNELEFSIALNLSEVQGTRTYNYDQPEHPYVAMWPPAYHGYEHTSSWHHTMFLTAIDEDRCRKPNFRHGARNQTVLDTTNFVEIGAWKNEGLRTLTSHAELVICDWKHRLR